MAEQSERRLIKWHEGVVITFISAVAYTYTFGYEIGYAQVFGIPTPLIEISFTSMLSVFVSLLAGLMLGMFLFSYIDIWKNMLTNALPLHLPDNFNKILIELLKRFYPLLIFIYIFFLINIYFVLPDSFYKPTLVFFIGGYITSQILFYKPIIKSETPSNTVTSKSSRSIFEKIPYLGLPGFFMVLVLLSGFYMAKYAGQMEAIHQKQYLVVNGNLESVVLRIYGDKIVCAPLDINTGKFKKEFTILKLNDKSEVKMSLMDIGPLQENKDGVK